MVRRPSSPLSICGESFARMLSERRHEEMKNFIRISGGWGVLSFRKKGVDVAIIF